MKTKLLSLALCATLTLSAFGASVPAAIAADAGRTTVYTFGSTEGPFRDLAQEAAQRKKTKKRKAVSEREQVRKENADMRKAAKERERRDKASKE